MNSTSNKTAVITGASSGIGHACLAKLSRAGWKIFATVRKTADQTRLQSEDASVTAVIMDVQDRASITAQQNRSLHSSKTEHSTRWSMSLESARLLPWNMSVLKPCRKFST